MFANAMNSLVLYGLQTSDGGFGTNYVETFPAMKTGNDRRRRISWVNEWDWPIQEERSQGKCEWRPSATDSTTVVDELDLLLTSGRLSEAVKSKIRAAYDAKYTAPSSTSRRRSPGSLGSSGASAALKIAQQMVMFTGEFHSSAESVITTTPRPPAAIPASLGRPYKAVIVLFLNGGIDSYNLLVPHSGCTANSGKDMYAEYAAVRTNVALAASDLLQIDEPTGKQPGSKFGLHPELPKVQELYQAGQASMLANIGQLIEPIADKDDAGKAEKPPQQYAHNFAQRNAENVHAQNAQSKGVIGRMMSALQSQASSWSTAMYSMNGNTKILEGGPVPADIVSKSGVVQYDEEIGPTVAEISEMLTPNQSTSIFTNTHTSLFGSALMRSKTLGDQLATATLTNTFPTTGIGMQFMQVSKLTKIRNLLQDERAAFFVEIGGFDTHKDTGPTMTEKLPEINQALAAFKAEMDAQGIWDNVAIVTVSDFARTLTSNGRGTDHGWGGNMMMLGGKVNGKKIHGAFPDDLTAESRLNIGRGRLIPTRSWESLWNAVGEWMGVQPSQMDTVLPNKKNFAANQMWTKDDLFKP